MKILSTITLSLFTSTSIYAQTTMCFKENHPSINTIENTKLDGGECLSQYSLKEMKEKGWKVNDIKISQSTTGKFNFVYILKKGEQIDFTMMAMGLSEEEMEDRILKRIEEKKEKEKKEAEIKRSLALIEDGKRVYQNKCSSCHGKNGEKSAYSSNQLNTLSLKQMTKAIGQYTNSYEYGGKYAYIMKPYASGVSNYDIEAIHTYLQSLKVEAK